MQLTKDIQKIFPEGKINEAQMTILNMFSLDLSSGEMEELKKILSAFLAKRADKMMHQMTEEGKFPSMKELEKMHVRTPYQMA